MKNMVYPYNLIDKVFMLYADGQKMSSWEFFETVDKIELEKNLEVVFKKMNPMARKVMNARFKKSMTYAEIEKVFRSKREVVKGIENKTIRWMRTIDNRNIICFGSLEQK